MMIRYIYHLFPMWVWEIIGVIFLISLYPMMILIYISIERIVSYLYLLNHGSLSNRHGRLSEKDAASLDD